jgi:acyl-CoA synthetase (AMP-forming)/AMP-acid ligase II
MLAERACDLRRLLGRVDHVVVDARNREATLDYAALVGAASSDLARRKTDPADVCMQPYTSGSTGRPKGVLLTHGGQIWNTDILRKATMVDDTERGLVAVPLYHKNAMAGVVKPFLLAGGAIVLLRGFDPVEVIRAVERYRVTYLTGVPAMYKMVLAERDALDRHDVSSVRFAMCGSAEVPDELLAEFRRVFNAPIAESYGLTEGGPVPLTNTRWGLKKRGARDPQSRFGERLLEASRSDSQAFSRWVVTYGRPDAPRPRRVLLFRRSQRRHDQCRR